MVAVDDNRPRPSLGRAILFQTGLVLSVLIWGTLSLFTVVLPYRARFWFVSRWCWWMGVWLRVACKVTVEAQGAENIPAGGGVIMAKHQSAWETFALVLWFYPQTWVLKRELLWLPLFGWALALLQPIAIDRGSGRKAFVQVLKQGRQRLADGRWVVVYPEGTRVPAGCRGDYRPGGAILASKTGATVVPVAHNAGELWPRGSFRIHPGTIRLRIGPPIAAAGKSPEALMRAVEGWIEGQMPAISEHGYPGTPYEGPAPR